MWTLFAKTEKYGEVCFPSSEFPNSKDNGQMYIAIFTVKFLPFFPPHKHVRQVSFAVGSRKSFELT